MTTLGYAALAILLLLFSVCSHLCLYKLGYADGKDKGFEKGVELGRKDADNWWINAEQEVDQARVKIWREGK